MDLAEPPLHAAIMISSSMMLSFVLVLPLCTMNTSWSLIEVPMLTLVSPLLKLESSQLATDTPSRSQMLCVSWGWEFPAKIFTPLILLEAMWNAWRGQVDQTTQGRYVYQ